MKLKRALFGLLMIAMLSLLLTGCWSRNELNELSIVSAIGIDYTDNQFEVSFQIINPQEVSGTSTLGDSSGETSVSIYKERAPTLIEAIRKASTKVPRRLYLTHLQLIVLGESLAEQGLEEIVDALSREEKFRPDFYVFMARRYSAGEILTLLTPLDRIPANFISGVIETTQKIWGAEQSVTAFSMIQMMQDVGEQLVLPGITIKGNIEEGAGVENLEQTISPAYLEVEGLAVFKEGKIVGWLDEHQARGFNFTRRQSKILGTMVLLKCSEEGYVSMDVFDLEPKVKLDVTGPVPLVTFSLRAKTNLTETSCHQLDLEQQATIRKLVSETEAEIKQMIVSAFEQAKEWKTDIFGIETMLDKRKQKYWKQNKDKFDNIIEVIDYKVNVDIKLENTGRYSNSILKEWED